MDNSSYELLSIIIAMLSLLTNVVVATAAITKG